MGRVISTCLQFIDAFSSPSRQAINSMRRMANEAKKAGKSIQGAGNVIQNAGKGIVRNVTTPIAGLGVAAIKASTDFENAMAKVSTIADTTKTPVSTLKEQVIDLSNTMGVGVSDLAEAQYQAISAGVDTAASVDFVSTAVKAAKGGFTDTATAVDGLTTVLNAYGMEAGRATDISDQMLMAQNYGKTSFGDMASSMGKVIPIASSLNVSTEELFSSIAVLTKNGIATSEAVTGLKAAYSNILKPSSDAAKMAEELGIDFSSAHLQSVGWAKFLDEIKEKTGGSAESMAKLFGSTEALNSVTVLAGKGSADFAEALSLMGNAGGATQSAYEKMLTPTERMHISLNKIKNSLIQFGTAMTPAFEKAAEIIGKVGNRLNGLSGSQVNSILKWAKTAAVVGPCIVTFGKAVTGIGKLVTGFGKVTSIIAKFGGILGVLTSPAAIVIGILAGIAAAAVLVYKNWDKLKPVFKTVMNVAKTAMAGMGQVVKNALKAAEPAIQTFKSAISEVLPKAMEAGKTAIKAVTPIIKTLAGVVKKTAPVIATTFAGVLKKLSPVFKTIGSAIKAVVPVIGKLLSGAFTLAGKTIKTIMPTVNKVAQVIGGVLVHAIRKVSPIVIKLSGVFATVFTGVFHTVSGIVKKLQPVFNLIGTIIKTVMGVVGTVISTTFHTAADVISSVAGNIKQIIDGVTQTFDGVITFITGVFTGNWKQAWDGIKDIFGGAFEALGGLCKAPINAVISIINKAIEGINGISVDIPEGVPLVGGKHIGFTIPTIPALAKGTPDWRGGVVQIHEKGGEIIDLPKGSRVYPHDQSVQMARNDADGKLKMADRKVAALEKFAAGKGGKGNITITIPKLAEQIIVRDAQDIDRLAEDIVRKLRDTALNMGAV